MNSSQSKWQRWMVLSALGVLDTAIQLQCSGLHQCAAIAFVENLMQQAPVSK
jgi:hypothetical protein